MPILAYEPRKELKCPSQLELKGRAVMPTYTICLKVKPKRTLRKSIA